MEGKINTNIKGLYHVQLRDSITGKIKYDNTFHNMLVCNGLGSMTNHNGVRGGWEVVNGLYVGTGTTEPNFSNTGLASLLWSASATSVNFVTSNDGYTQKSTKTFSFPATSSYVSNSISEAGLFYQWRWSSESGGASQRYPYMVTRCLFTDSEGHSITIAKTDLDILDITVEIEITLNSSNENIFKMYPNQRKVLSNIMSPITGNQGAYEAFGKLSLFKFDEDRNGIHPNGSNPNIDFGAYSVNNGLAFGTSIDNTTKTATLTHSNVRIPSTSITSETYYRGLGFGVYGIFMFPSSEFTPYDITEIEIGVGDGESTEFLNPLSYFLEDSQKIYIDEVEVPDTDYTINHMGNVNKKFEVSQNIKPLTATSDILYNDSIWGEYTGEVASMFKPTTTSRKVISKFDTTLECFGINSDNPAILDFGEAKTFNFIQGYNIKLLRKAKSGGAYSQTTSTATIYVDSSDNGTDWDEVTSVNISSNSIFKDFDESVTARYWRIRTNLAAEDTTYYNVLCIRSDNYTSDCGIALGNCDPMIVFDTAPADGAVITMSVKMDIIMKNSNFVVDLAPIISLQVTS